MGVSSAASSAGRRGRTAYTDFAGIVVLLVVFEQVDRDRQHFAHHRNPRRAFLEPAFHQATIIGPKSGAFRVSATQGSQIEDPSEQPAAPFGELGLPEPSTTFFDLNIQAPVGNGLVRAAKARHMPQFRAQDRHRFESKLLHL